MLEPISPGYVQGVVRYGQQLNILVDNMLWHQGKVHFIDVGQSVEPSHPHGLEFLLRDCRNVSNFFSRSGVADVMDPHQLFNYVSGLDIKAESDQEFLAQVMNCVTVH